MLVKNILINDQYMIPSGFSRYALDARKRKRGESRPFNYDNIVWIILQNPCIQPVQQLWLNNPIRCRTMKQLSQSCR